MCGTCLSLSRSTSFKIARLPSGCDHSLSFSRDIIFPPEISCDSARRAPIRKTRSELGEKSRDDERDIRTTIVSAYDCHRYSRDSIAEADFQKIPIPSSCPPLPPKPIQHTARTGDPRTGFRSHEPFTVPRTPTTLRGGLPH